MYKDFVDFVRKVYNTEEFIPLHAPVFSGNEKPYLMECIDTTFVSSVGKFVDRFEDEMKNYTGAKHAVAIVNGTAALHISLLLAGVKQGELVITQALSFIATCNAISYLNAEPVFIDIDAGTLSLSAGRLLEFIETQCQQKNGSCYHKASGRRIGACVPMHTFGHPAEIDKIADICTKNNIPLVEDAAESIGSSYKGKQTGTFGLMGTFSFNGNKTITCGGGGAVVTNDEGLAKMAKHLTTQAKVPHRWEFVHDHIGYNYRMPNINAALACAQLEQLDGFLENKRELATLYADFLQNKQPEFFKEPAGARSNYWLNTVLCKNREERDSFLTYTNDRGVMTRPSWELINRLHMFAGCINDGLKTSEEMAARLVNIPSSVRKTNS
jgi:perosamine synthetase